MNIPWEAKFWAVALGVLILMLWLLEGVLLPFVAGAAIAYFLDPVADRLETMGLNRVLSTTIITACFFILVISALVLLIPALYEQIHDFALALPGYLQKLRAWGMKSLGPDVAKLLARPDRALDAIKDGGNADLARSAFDWGLNLLQKLAAGGRAIVGTLSFLILTPVVAFYFLLDWDHMTAKVDSWLPRDHAGTIRLLLHRIDRALAGFVRGQLSVCVILATYYGLGLSILGLDYGLAVGITAGLLSFIPYVGSGLGLITSFLLAMMQFWPEWHMVAGVLGVFLVGQVLEGNFLTPKLVGESVGLHPVWLIFSLLAFGSLFGFVGLLVAVPVAAMIGVLVRFALESYMASPLYKGRNGGEAAGEGP